MILVFLRGSFTFGSIKHPCCSWLLRLFLLSWVWTCLLICLSRCGINYCKTATELTFGQPSFVSLATNILTGIHGMCLLTVILWFIYQLKYDSIWVRWITTAMMWILMSPLRIMWRAMVWIWKVVSWPYVKYRQHLLHLQRNISWYLHSLYLRPRPSWLCALRAFGIDNRVASLNYHMIGTRDWPDPYLLSRTIRFIAYPIKKCCLATKKAFSDLCCFIWFHLCVCSCARRTESDIESGGRERREKAEGPEENPMESPVEKAKDEFRISLRNNFSNANRVDSIMHSIQIWGEGE